MPLELGEGAQIRKVFGTCAACQERWIVGAVFGDARRSRRMLAGEGLCCRGREALAREPGDGGKLVEKRTRETRLIVVAMNGEPRVWIAPASEQWQQRARRA